MGALWGLLGGHLGRELEVALGRLFEGALGKVLGGHLEGHLGKFYGILVTFKNQ